MFSISVTNSVCICICIDFMPLVKYVHVKKHKENLWERVGWWIAAILPRAITFAPCVIKIRKSSKISNTRSLASRNDIWTILFKNTRSSARGRRTIANNTTIAIVRVIFKCPCLHGNYPFWKTNEPLPVSTLFSNQRFSYLYHFLPSFSVK